MEQDNEPDVECAVCSTDISSDSMFTTKEDTQVCGECLRVCERCDEAFTVEDNFSIIDGDTWWCRDCTDCAASWCEHCEGYVSEGTYEVSDRAEDWCTHCVSDNAGWCDNCECYYADGCNNCDFEDEEGNRIIHDYSYRPDAIFHSTDKNERLFFGIEVELEALTNYQDSSNYAYRLEGMELAYLKQDGSLNHGFEIVTHPMSHDFYKNEASELWDTLENLRTTYRVKSWDTTTCGLHIHISRTGFNGGAHMHRFLNLVYSNQNFYETLAGRNSSSWAKFDDVYMQYHERDAEGNRILDADDNYVTSSKRDLMSKLGNHSTDRYSAVNTNNRETLEMRIFRGTVNGNTIKSQLDLAHASVEYTRNLSVKDVREGAMLPRKFAEYIYSNSELYSDLVKRMNRTILYSEKNLQEERV